MSDPQNLHGTALVIDMATLLDSQVLATAEGEGEEQDDGIGERDDDFGEAEPEHGRPNRHQSVGVGCVQTALREGAVERLTRSLQSFLGPARSPPPPGMPDEEEESDEGATMLAIGPGWLATGYNDGSVRLQRLPSDLAWSHEPGTCASALRDGAHHVSGDGGVGCEFPERDEDDGGCVIA